MKKQMSILVNSDSGYQITLKQQTDDIQKIFSQFKEDFDDLNSPPINESKNFLAPTLKAQRRPSTIKSKDKKRMKLIDYIYIKNTAKKNQQSKIQKTGMSTNQLRKSRMKEGKQKAFKAIVDQMIGELKQLSIKASAMSELVEDSIAYTGNTDEITTLCNVRRLLKENILGSLSELQKHIGIDDHELEAKITKNSSRKQDQDIDERLKRLQQIGVKRLGSQTDFLALNPQQCFPKDKKNSNKDTWISEKYQY